MEPLLALFTRQNPRDGPRASATNPSVVRAAIKPTLRRILGRELPGRDQRDVGKQIEPRKAIDGRPASPADPETPGVVGMGRLAGAVLVRPVHLSGIDRFLTSTGDVKNRAPRRARNPAGRAGGYRGVAGPRRAVAKSGPLAPLTAICHDNPSLSTTTRN